LIAALAEPARWRVTAGSVARIDVNWPTRRAVAIAQAGTIVLDGSPDQRCTRSAWSD
jgi:hypothetical protein